MSDLVSCLMVTRPSPARLPYIERAAGFYARQTLPRRELVVVLDEGEECDRADVERVLRAFKRDDVRVVRADGRPTLGALRNSAIAEARGDLLCIWDDDDIHHPRRLELQVQALKARGAVSTFLTDVLHLFVCRRELYWTTYKKTIQGCVPGAGLFRRPRAARYPEDGPASRRGEDTAFCLQLFEEGPVHFVSDSPHLYIYVHHGHNTSGDEHHQKLRTTLALSCGKIERARDAIWEALEVADLALDEVNVMGNNGPAFVWRRGLTSHASIAKRGIP